MLQLLAALALVMGLALGHIRPMDGAGGPPVPKASPATVTPAAFSAVHPLDGAGGPPVP